MVTAFEQWVPCSRCLQCRATVFVILLHSRYCPNYYCFKQDTVVDAEIVRAFADSVSVTFTEIFTHLVHRKSSGCIERNCNTLNRDIKLDETVNVAYNECSTMSVRKQEMLIAYFKGVLNMHRHRKKTANVSNSQDLDYKKI
nr:hypothetical protein MACL_00001705 [Theileria orientalis]